MQFSFSLTKTIRVQAFILFLRKTGNNVPQDFFLMSEDNELGAQAHHKQPHCSHLNQCIVNSSMSSIPGDWIDFLEKGGSLLKVSKKTAASKVPL